MGAASDLVPTPRDVAAVERRTPRLQKPWMIGAIAFAAAALLAVARLTVLAHGDPSIFIFAGTRYSKGIDAYHSITLFRSSGYDGQFFYRLALDPARLQRTAFGITLDTSYRLQRIGYPVLAWLLAAGRGSLVPWSLIGVNVAAFGVLGWVSGALARDSGRAASAGLLLVGFWGFAFSLSRDTAEIATSAFAMAALLALRRHRPWWAAALFTGAVLTRETTLLIVAAVALEDIWLRVRRKHAPGRPGWGAFAAWAAPVVAFLGWQVVVHLASARFAGAADLASNVGAPFQALYLAVSADMNVLADIGYVRTHVQLITVLLSGRDLAELAVLVAMSTLALRSLRTSVAAMREKIAFVLMGIGAVCLAPNDLVHLANQRSLDQLYLLAGLILLNGRRRHAVLGTLAAALWLAVAVGVVFME